MDIIPWKPLTHWRDPFGTLESFSLPSEVDPQNVKATYKDGVLEVVLPKKEGGKPKQIKVDIQ